MTARIGDSACCRS